MGYTVGRPEHIENALVHMHEGEWFDWSDRKNKIYANLILNPTIYDSATDSFVANPHTLPTEEEVNAKLLELQQQYDARQNAKETAKQKLQDLGLTVDEIKEAFGL